MNRLNILRIFKKKCQKFSIILHFLKILNILRGQEHQISRVVENRFVMKTYLSTIYSENFKFDHF